MTAREASNNPGGSSVGVTVEIGVKVEESLGVLVDLTVDVAEGSTAVGVDVVLSAGSGNGVDATRVDVELASKDRWMICVGSWLETLHPASRTAIKSKNKAFFMV